MRRGIFLLIGILLATLPAPAQAPVPRVAPFDLLKSHHMTVAVRINGKGPYRMIFDTGAPVTILGTRAAREAGVVPRDLEPPPMALFNAMGQFPVNRFEIGTVRAEKMPALVMDHPAVAALSRGGKDLEGIVGFSFFARYAMTLDYETKELSFAPSGYVPDDFMEVMMAYIAAKRKPPPRRLDPSGIWGFTVTKDEKDTRPGVAVESVRPGTPAAKAGLQPGDRLLTLDGIWTDSIADCYHAAGTVKTGIAAPLTIRRGGKDLTVTVTPKPGL